jgi:hypothetical protein
MGKEWLADEGDEVLIGAPAVPMSDAIFERLKQAVEADCRILFACVPQMYLRGKIDPPGQVLCIVLGAENETSRDKILHSLTKRLQGSLGPGKHIDIFPMPLEHEWLTTIVDTGCVLAVNDAAAFARFS